MQNYKPFAFSLIAFLLTGCVHHTTTQSIDMTNLESLENLNPEMTQYKESKISKIRTMALEDTAMSIGARSGLAKRSQEINTSLEEQTERLNSIYDFNALLLNHSVLPPVLVESNNATTLDDDDTIRTADKTYRIVEQARFVSAPPTWRNYLWMNYQIPEPPDRTLLPKTPEERKIWKHFVELGWEKGFNQANEIYASNLAKLTRDYQGMLIYRDLLEHNMISAPIVARSELGITGDESQMRINDQVLRITKKPSLQVQETQQWKPVIIK